MLAESWISIGGILDFHPWKSRLSGLLLDDEIDGVEVRPSLPSSGDLDEGAALKFLDEAIDARDAHSDILGKTILAGKAEVVVPGIAEEQRVDRLRADGNVWVAQNEVRDLGEPVESHRVGGVELHVALNALNLFTDVLHAVIIKPVAGTSKGLSTSLTLGDRRDR